MNLRLVLRQAIPVLPEPIVKSNTISFSFVYVLIKYSNNSTGFCVGCNDFVLSFEKNCIERGYLVPLLTVCFFFYNTAFNKL